MSLRYKEGLEGEGEWKLSGSKGGEWASDRGTCHQAGTTKRHFAHLHHMWTTCGWTRPFTRGVSGVL